MANTQQVTKNSFIVKARFQQIFIQGLGFLFLFALIILFPIISSYLPFFIILVMSIGYIIPMLTDSEIKRNFRSGNTELSVYKHLKKLPDKFIIFNQIEIPSEKNKFGHFELDFIVVSPSGIFVIEAKRYRGKVIGENYGDWLSILHNKRGLPFKKSQKNPIIQVSYQIDAIADFLLEYGIKTNITGLVYLDKLNPDSELPEKPKYKIFANKDICDHLEAIEEKNSKFIQYNKGMENYFNISELFRLVKNKTIL